MSSTESIGAAEGEIFWEARGAGSPVLLVPGTPGDGGQFDRLARELSEDHLVITYDRRGTSRSARPEGWSTTSVDEQADDAAGVLATVGVDSAVVFGTSNGAAIALELALRHPRRVARAILHEMPLMTVLADPEPVTSAMGSVIGAAMQDGGPTAALEAFLRFAFGDETVDELPPALRGRLLENAEMVFSIELPGFQSYRPDPQLLARCPVPISIMVGEQQQAPFFREAAQWLADQLEIEVSASPGAHGPQFSCPDQLAVAIHTFAGA
jgi:pimeloyl-ACP methyl ester carboxylesterase